jgi:hypothetical protein
MRLLLRIFSLSSWLALAACGIVLNSCAMAPPDVTAPPPPAGHTVAAIWSPPFAEQNGPGRQRSKRVGTAGGSPPAILSYIAGAIHPLAGTADKASGRFPYHSGFDRSGRAFDRT